MDVMNTVTEATAPARIAAAVRSHPLPVYFLATYAATWALLYPVLGADDLAANPALAGLYLLGGFVPSLVALALVGVEGGRPAVRRLLGRGVAWRVDARWYLAALGLPAAVKCGALLVVFARTGSLPSFASLGPWPILLAVAIVGGLVPGALGEELGWRGYALPRLQRGYHPLVAALVLGVLWAGWHLPTFVIGFTGQASIPVGWMLFEIVGASVLYAWVVNGSGGSAFLAIVFHAANNAFTPVVYPALAEAGYAALYGQATAILVWVAALGVVALAGPSLAAD